MIEKVIENVVLLIGLSIIGFFIMKCEKPPVVEQKEATAIQTFDEALDEAKKVYHETKQERDIYAVKSAVADKTLNKMREIIRLSEEVKCELKSSR